MKIDGLSDLEIEFINQYFNDDYPLITRGAIIHFVEIDGRLRMMLEINETTKMSHIAESKESIEYWRDALYKFQGPTVLRTWIFEKLSDLQKQGWTWKMVASLYPFADKIDMFTEPSEMVRRRIEQWRKSHV